MILEIAIGLGALLALKNKQQVAAATNVPASQSSGGTQYLPLTPLYPSDKLGVINGGGGGQPLGGGPENQFPPWGGGGIRITNPIIVKGIFTQGGTGGTGTSGGSGGGSSGGIGSGFGSGGIGGGSGSFAGNRGPQLLGG